MLASTAGVARPTDPLARLFAGLLVSVTAGCADDSDGIDAGLFEDDVCDESGWHVLQAVEPAAAVDYLQLRTVTEFGYFEDASERFSEPRVLDADGELCASASDPGACEEAFSALPYASEFTSYTDFTDMTDHRSVGYTRGNEVGVALTDGELQAFLGRIDSPGDAALWLSLQGHSVVCREGNDVGPHRDGFVVHTSTGDGCGSDISERVVLVRPDGSVQILRTEVVSKSDPGCSIGRLPEGYCGRGASTSTNPVGRFLAQVAELEAASVPAFEQLGDELRVHRSPASFIAAARAARADEVRHAAITARLARMHGAQPRPPAVRRMPCRDMVSMVADNAAEGCVRETFGALVAHVQSRRAQDPAVRGAMRSIARDETRHARLSWDVARWARPHMTLSERAQVARRARQSIDRLREELTAPQHSRVHDAVGIPDPEQARAMFAGLHAGLLRELES